VAAAAHDVVDGFKVLDAEFTGHAGSFGKPHRPVNSKPANIRKVKGGPDNQYFLLNDCATVLVLPIDNGSAMNPGASRAGKTKWFESRARS